MLIERDLAVSIKGLTTDLLPPSKPINLDFSIE